MDKTRFFAWLWPAIQSDINSCASAAGGVSGHVNFRRSVWNHPRRVISAKLILRESGGRGKEFIDLDDPICGSLFLEEQKPCISAPGAPDSLRKKAPRRKRLFIDEPTPSSLKTQDCESEELPTNSPRPCIQLILKVQLEQIVGKSISCRKQVTWLNVLEKNGEIVC